MANDIHEVDSFFVESRGFPLRIVEMALDRKETILRGVRIIDAMCNLAGFASEFHGSNGYWSDYGIS